MPGAGEVTAMERIDAAICLLLGCALAILPAGCVSIARMNVIQYPAREAKQALPFVTAAAKSLGYDARADEDSVAVILDDSAWLKFDVRCDYLDCEPGDFVFWVILDEEKVALKDREAKFAWGKRIGDEVWRVASDLRTGRAVPDSVQRP